MGSVVVTADDGRNYSIEVTDLKIGERMQLATQAPEELAEIGEDIDNPSDVSDDEIALTEDINEYLRTAITTATDFDDDDLAVFSVDFQVRLGVKVLKELFAGARRGRLRRVNIDESSLVALFTNECALVSGLPDDIEFVDFQYAPVKQEFHLIFESEEWSRVGTHEEIPIVETQFIGFDISENHE